MEANMNDWYLDRHVVFTVFDPNTFQVGSIISFREYFDDEVSEVINGIISEVDGGKLTVATAHRSLVFHVTEIEGSPAFNGGSFRRQIIDVKPYL